MQKLLFIMLLIMTINCHSAFEDFQPLSISQKQDTEKESVVFLESPTIKNDSSIYLEQEDESYHIDDYDHTITDNVNPPVIGPVQAMCQEFLAGLLIRYIIIKESAHNYLKIAKNMCNQWYQKIVKIGR